MKTKIIASLVVLGLAFSVLMFMFVTGCGVTSGGGTVSNPRLYISDVTNKRVLIIDPTNLTLLGSVELSGASSPKWMAIHPDGSKVYIGDEGSNDVFVLRTSDNSTETITVCFNPRGMTFNSTASLLYVLCNQGGSNADIAIIDTSLDSLVGGINGGFGTYFGSDCYGIDYNPATDKLYVADRSDNRLLAVPATAGTHTVESVSSPSAFPYDVKVAPGGGVVYLSTWTSNMAYLISFEASGMTMVTSWAAQDDGFRNIAISPNGQYLYVGEHDYSYIDSLDLTGGSSLTKINTRSTPPGAWLDGIHQIAFSPDSSKAYAVQFEAGIGTASREVVIINTAQATREGAILLPLPVSGTEYFGIVYKP